MAKPRFFSLDADLWQVPGPLKLDWPTRKLAIYLREASSHHADPACYRTRKRIKQDLGLSDRVLSTSLQRLKQWPNTAEPFLVVEDDGEIILRPLPNRKVQVFRCLWDSELPDSYKDILLFAWSQYRGDAATGSRKQHVYALNLCGQKAPSILRCCHISRQRGTTFKKLIRQLRREIESYGFVEVLFSATSKRPAIIAAPDEARLHKALRNYRDKNSTAASHDDGTRMGARDAEMGARDAEIGARDAEMGARDIVSCNHAHNPEVGKKGSSGAAPCSPVQESFSSFCSDSLSVIPSPPKTEEESHAHAYARGEGEEEVSEQEGPPFDTGEGHPDLDVSCWIESPKCRALVKEVERRIPAIHPTDQHLPSVAADLERFIRNLPRDTTAEDIIVAIKSSELIQMRESSWGLFMSQSIPWRDGNTKNCKQQLYREIQKSVNERLESEKIRAGADSRIRAALESRDPQQLSHLAYKLRGDFAKSQYYVAAVVLLLKYNWEPRRLLCDLTHLLFNCRIHCYPSKYLSQLLEAIGRRLQVESDEKIQHRLLELRNCISAQVCGTTAAA